MTNGAITPEDLEFAEAWRPEVGDYLIGTIAGIDMRDGGYGLYPIITVQRDDGSRAAFHGMSTVAKNEIAAQRPEVGDGFGVKYHGKATGPRGEYDKFVIRVAKASKPETGAEVDWAKMQADAKTELGEQAPSIAESEPPF